MNPYSLTDDQIHIELLNLAFLALHIAAVGFIVLWLVGRKSPVRERRGWFVLVWMLFGFVAGGAVSFKFIDARYLNPGEEGDIALAMCGLLGGWLVGLIHSAIDVRQKRSMHGPKSKFESENPSQ